MMLKAEDLCGQYRNRSAHRPQVTNLIEAAGSEEVGRKLRIPSKGWLEERQIEQARSQLQELISDRRIAKSGSSIEAELCSDGKIGINKVAGKLAANMGYFEDGKHFLHPEQVYFLMDAGHLSLIDSNGSKLSLQQSFYLMLDHISIAEYLVFAHLSRDGYLAVRHQGKLNYSQYEIRVKLHKHALAVKRQRLKDINKEVQDDVECSVVEETSKQETTMKSVEPETGNDCHLLSRRRNKRHNDRHGDEQSVEDSSTSPAAYLKKRPRIIEKMTAFLEDEASSPGSSEEANYDQGNGEMDHVAADRSPLISDVHPNEHNVKLLLDTWNGLPPNGSATRSSSVFLDELETPSPSKWSRRIRFPDVGQCTKVVLSRPDPKYLPSNLSLLASEELLTVDMELFECYEDFCLASAPPVDDPQVSSASTSVSSDSYNMDLSRQAARKYEFYRPRGWVRPWMPRQRLSNWVDYKQKRAIAMSQAAELWEGRVVPLIHPSDSEEEAYRTLRIIESFNESDIENPSQQESTLLPDPSLKISFDVFRNKAGFKPSAESVPDYRVAVLNCSDRVPCYDDIIKLKNYHADGVPILIAVVDGTDICFYQNDAVQLRLH